MSTFSSTKAEHNNWFQETLKKVNYKAEWELSDADEQTESDLRSLKAVLAELGCSNVFTQEELAFYKRLESAGQQLEGARLTSELEARKIPADPRKRVDRLVGCINDQQATLNRLQARLTRLGNQKRVFENLKAAGFTEAENVKKQADREEQQLLDLYQKASGVLSENEELMLTTAQQLGSLLCADGEGNINRKLFSAVDVAEMKNAFSELNQLIQHYYDTQVTREELACDKVRSIVADFQRLHDACSVAMVSVIMAQAECASADSELRYLRSVVERGCEVPSKTNTATSNELHKQMQDDVQSVKSLCREVFVAVQTHWKNPNTAGFQKALELQKRCLAKGVDTIHNASYYRSQLLGATFVASEWAKKEEREAKILHQYLDAYSALVVKMMAMKNGFGAVSPEANDVGDSMPGVSAGISRLVALAEDASASHDTRSKAPHSRDLGQAIANLKVRINEVEEAINRSLVSGKCATVSLEETLVKALRCLGRGAEARSQGTLENEFDALLTSQTRTRFDEDLTGLKLAIDKASERLLYSMDRIDEDKRHASWDWVEAVAEKTHGHTMTETSRVFEEERDDVPPTRLEGNRSLSFHPDPEDFAESSGSRGSVSGLGLSAADKISAASVHSTVLEEIRTSDTHPPQERRRNWNASPREAEEAEGDVRYGRGKNEPLASHSHQLGQKEPPAHYPTRIHEGSPPAPTELDAKKPPFLFRSDGTRLKPEEYRAHNMRLLQEIRKL